MLTRRQKLVFAATTASGAIVPLSLWVRRQGLRAVVDDLTELTPAPVALVLGCYARPDGTPCSHLQERLEAATRVYQRGLVEQLLISGNASAVADEVAAMQRWLLAHGVPPEHILMDPTGVRTFASMRNAARIHGVQRMVVCTHRYHLPRSLYLAQRFGIHAQGYAADKARLKAPIRTLGREFGARAMAAVDSWAATRRPQDRRADRRPAGDGES